MPQLLTTKSPKLGNFSGRSGTNSNLCQYNFFLIFSLEQEHWFLFKVSGQILGWVCGSVVGSLQRISEALSSSPSAVEKKKKTTKRTNCLGNHNFTFKVENKLYKFLFSKRYFVNIASYIYNYLVDLLEQVFVFQFTNKRDKVGSNYTCTLAFHLLNLYLGCDARVPDVDFSVFLIRWFVLLL